MPVLINSLIPIPQLGIISTLLTVCATPIIVILMFTTYLLSHRAKYYGAVASRKFPMVCKL